MFITWQTSRLLGGRRNILLAGGNILWGERNMLLRKGNMLLAGRNVLLRDLLFNSLLSQNSWLPKSCDRLFYDGGGGGAGGKTAGREVVEEGGLLPFLNLNFFFSFNESFRKK
uniref:Uncharacterized protein n=1 Tax=Meloidogyne incognita TaxID=6306 RepID=A0A914LK21_MELIC